SSTESDAGMAAYTTARPRSTQQVIGSTLLSRNRRPVEFAIGMITPDRNICGIVISMTARLAALLFLITPITIIASAPPDRHISGARASRASRLHGERSEEHTSELQSRFD